MRVGTSSRRVATVATAPRRCASGAKSVPSVLTAQGEEQVPFAHLTGIGRRPTDEGVYMRGPDLRAHSPRGL